MTISNVVLDRIDANPWQTRHDNPDPEYISELATDIEKRGLLQIPIGRISQNGKSIDDPETRIELAFGHNRLAAYIHLANNHPGGGLNSPWARMPVDVRTLTDEEMADMAWAENERRRDHTPIDRALAIQKRMEDFGYSHAQVAEHLGISRPVVSNALRLLKLPEEYQEKLRAGDISERQALSILPLFDLPASILDQAESYYDRDIRPSAILDDLNDGISSGEIRRRISLIAGHYGVNLENAGWGMEEFFEVTGDIVSPDCKSCPARVKERNLCTNRACYHEKERIWEGSYLAKAGEASGIQPIEKDLSRYDVTTFSYYRDEQHISAIRSSGCENLRLLFNRHIYGDVKENPNRLQDLDFELAEIVCCKRSGWCSCLKGLQYQKQNPVPMDLDPEDEITEESIEENMQHVAGQGDGEPPTAEDLHELARQARSERRQAGRMTKDVVRIAGEAIAKALLDKNLDVWKLMGRQIHYTLSNGNNQEIFFDKYLLAIGEYIATQALPYQPDNIDAVLRSVNSKLIGCGLDPITLEEVRGEDTPS